MDYRPRANEEDVVQAFMDIQWLMREETPNPRLLNLPVIMNVLIDWAKFYAELEKKRLQELIDNPLEPS